MCTSRSKSLETRSNLDTGTLCLNPGEESGKSQINTVFNNDVLHSGRQRAHNLRASVWITAFGARLLGTKVPAGVKKVGSSRERARESAFGL